MRTKQSQYDLSVSIDKFSFFSLGKNNNPAQQKVITPTEKNITKPIPKKDKRTLVLWSNDNHIGPIEDLKFILNNFFDEYNFVIHDHSISIYCAFVGTCAKPNSTPLTYDASIAITREVKRDYFNKIRDNPQFKESDLLFCSHPPPLCQIYFPFNKWKSIIAITAVPFYSSSRNFIEWEQNYVRMLENPNNIVVSNNLVGAEDINFHTGKKPKVMRSLCLYVRKQLGGMNSTYLHPNFQTARDKSLEVFKSKTNNQNLKRLMLSRGACDPIRALFAQNADYMLKEGGVTLDLNPPSYDHKRILENYEGVVFHPYTSSLMAFFEYYILNIPMFLPSVKFMVQEYDRPDRAGSLCVHGLPFTLRWDMRHQTPLMNKDAQKLFDLHGIAAIRNPATRPYWYSLMDYFDQKEFPNLIYYDSIEDLVKKASALRAPKDFVEISTKMDEANNAAIKRIVGVWKADFERILQKKEENKKFFPEIRKHTYESAMQVSGYIVRD